MDERIAQSFKDYFKELKSKHKVATETTFRTNLENLLNKIKSRPTITIIHEGKKAEGELGKPDFKAEEKGLVLGYVETKPLGTNLEDIINPKKITRESEQLKKYLKVTNNFILTNYTEFIHIKNGVPLPKRILFSIEDKELDDSAIKKISDLLDGFFLFSLKLIEDPKQLSSLLAERAILFRDALTHFIEVGTTGVTFKERLVGENGLHQVFKDTLIEDLSQEAFIDSYVQTITYGLFLARLNSKEQTINKKNAFDFIPSTLGVIRELFRTTDIADIPSQIDWIIEEMITVLNHTNVVELKKRLAFSKVTGYEDPYVYFYENFLLAYDKETKIEIGAFYTPIPIVWFIIKSLDIILKKEFRNSGLKDSNVTALDFATGTGTFLLEAFKKCLEDTEKGLRKNLIKEHLLQHFNGFEFKVPPYTIAHLKLSQFLTENDYIFGEKDRLRVYLTDTLDDQRHKTWALFPTLSEEGTEANKIKLEEPILVIMGNPPYSNHSKNNGEWITNLIKDYKTGLKEQKINLDDDYIKFLRFAQWKIDKTGKGVLGVITNNSFLDGNGHRLMRKKLLETFDKLYILNLHGNSKKRELDKNVFDIRVGVTISLFVKLPHQVKEKEVYYHSILADKAVTREEKYEFLLKNDLSTLNWKRIYPNEPKFRFDEIDTRFEKVYNKGLSLPEIFKVLGSAIKTDRDELFIDFDNKELTNKMRTLLSGKWDEDFKRKYNVENSSSYHLLDKLEDKAFDDKKICAINYRPFDNRWIYYDPKIISRPDFEVIQHFAKENIGIVFSRFWDLKSEWNGILVTDQKADIHDVGGGSYIAPLYLYLPEEDKQQRPLKASIVERQNPYKGRQHQPNFTDDFLQFIAKNYSSVPEPEDILAYVYAVLHSPAYRKKYTEFLKEDFPRVPFTTNIKIFNRLAKLGSELVDLHLLKKDLTGVKNIAKFSGSNGNLVEKPKYNTKNERLYLNNDQYFENVPNAVWEFEIGGYQVVYKWLSERKGRKINYEDITHIQKVMRILTETIKLMEKIDVVFREI